MNLIRSAISHDNTESNLIFIKRNTNFIKILFNHLKELFINKIISSYYLESNISIDAEKFAYLKKNIMRIQEKLCKK
jgi:predicted nucleotidyltransferase component of viral defense system